MYNPNSSRVPMAFDKRALAPLDVNVRQMVDRSYELCNYRCLTSKGGSLADCKSGCFKDIILSYRRAGHLARDGEEGHYRKCLSRSPNFPNLE